MTRTYQERTINVTLPIVMVQGFAKVYMSHDPAQRNKEIINNSISPRASEGLSVSKAAKILKISPSTLRRLEQNGKIKSTRAANGYRSFSIDEIRKLKVQLDKQDLLEKPELRVLEKQLKTNNNIKPSQKNIPVTEEIKTGQSYKQVIKPKYQLKNFNKLSNALQTATITLILVVILGAFGLKGTDTIKYKTVTNSVKGLLTTTNTSESLLDSDNTEDSAVLAERSQNPLWTFNINVPSTFRQDVQITQNLQIDQNANIDGIVTTPNVTFTGTGTINQLDAIDDITETTLENALDINGDVIGIGLNNVTIVDGAITVNKLADVLEYEGTLSIEGEFLLGGDSGSEGDILTSGGSGIPQWVAPSEINAGQVDGLSGDQFLRSDTSDEFTSGTLSLSNGTFLDLGTIDHTSTSPQGIRLPQSTAFTAPSSGEGYIAWDTASNTLVVYDGSSWSSIQGLFTNSGDLTYLSETTDNLTIGGTTSLAKLGISGDADEIQLLVRGNSTQTTDLVVFEQSDGTNVFSVNNNGTITIPSGQDLVIGSIGLGDTAASTTSGANLIGVYTDIFTNISPVGSDLQSVLETIDSSIGSGSSRWSTTSGTLHPNTLAENLAVGGTSPTAAPFGINVSSNTVYIGDAVTAGNTTLTFKSNSGASTGNLIYNTSDQFQFSGGNVVVDGQLITGSSVINLTTATGYLDADAIQLLNLGTGSTASSSGLEVSSDRIGLLQGCANGEVLKWNEASGLWQCATDSGASSAVVLVEENDVSVGTNVGTLDFINVFSLNESPSGEVNIDIADNALNFTELESALTLDTDTSINFYTGAADANLRYYNSNDATELLFIDGNNGRIGIGNTSPSALLGIGSTNQFTVNSSGAITAATGITSSGNITFSGLSTDGVVTVSSGLLDSEAQLAIARGGTNSTATPTAGAISYGTGTAYGFSTAGTSGQLLQSNGTGAPTWVDSDTVGINYWDRTGTLVTPLTITDNIATLGSIGVGTTNPAAALSVGATSEFRVDSNGNITRINDVAYSFPASQAAAPNYVLTNDGSGNLTWQSVSGVGGITGSGSTGQLTYWNASNSLTGNFNLFWNNSNSRLGIGTSAPATALDINNGNITLSDNYWLGLGTAAGRIEFDNQATDEINFLGANVGIGTSSPSSLLSVGATNQFTVNGSGAITAATGITSSGNITFSGLSTDGVVTVSSGLLGSEAQLAIARGGTNSTATPTAGAIAYGTGTAYGFSSAGTSGQLLQSNGTGAPTWINAASVGTNYWDRTGTLVTPLTITDNVATLGSIGIGTTNPAAALSVGGSSEFRVDTNGNITRINDVAYSFPASQAASDNYVLTNDGSGNLTWESVSGVGGLTGSGNTGQLTYWNAANSIAGNFNFFLDTTNNRLGIGTSAPTSALDINNGNITLSDNYWLGLGTAAGRIEFDNQATDEINFLGANVGIGTSSPSALLSVGAGSQFTVNGSGAVTAATGITSSGNITFSGLSTDGVVTVSSGLLGSEAQLATARGGTNSIATPTAGAISYGTGTAYNFSSAGTSGQLLQSNGTGAPTWINSASVGTNYWDRTGTLVTPLTISDDLASLGNVGIGLTNPIGALHVTGDEVRIGDAGTINFATADGDLYVEDALEVDGSTYLSTLYLAGTQVTSTAAELNLLDGSTAVLGGLVFGNGTYLTQDAANIFWDDSTNRLGIGTTGPQAALSVGATSEFRVDSTGNVTRINDIAYSFPASQAGASNYVLTNDGSGNLTWESVSGVGGLTGSGSTGQATFWNGTNALTGNFNYFWDNNTNRLGIGTSAPQASLSVGSSSEFRVDASGNVTRINDVVYSFPASQATSGNYVLTNDGSGNLTWESVSGVGGLTGSGNTGQLTYWNGTNALTGNFNLFWDTSTNRLGIGTSAPQASLSIGSASEFRVDSNGNVTRINDVAYSFPASQAASDNYVLTNDGSGNLTWESVSGVGGITGAGSNGQLTYWNGANSLTGNFDLFLDSNNSRLGIGTSAPTTALDINNGNITLSDNYWLGLGTSAGRIEFDNQATDEINFLDANVGIGTSSPSALLSVGATNQFTINGSGAITAAAGITSSGNITFSGLSTDGVVTVSSGLLGSEAQLAIARGGTNSTATPTAGAIAYGTGTAYGFSSAGTSGQLLQSNGTGAPTWVNAASVGTNYWDRTGTLVTPLTIADNIATLGSIGVGTTNPAAALSVGAASEFRVDSNGNITRINDVAYSFPASQAAADNYVLTNDGSGNLTWESVSGVGGLTGSGSNGQLTYWNGANSLTGNFNLFLDTSNTRLGIGTSAPTTALDINNGNITLSDNYWLGLGTAAGRIEFDNQATDEINFLGANVGIGTSSPSALLSVGASSQFTVNGSGAITAATGITSSGNITFSGLSTDGVVTVSSGLLGSEAQLAIARGGTNSTATPTAGAISYGTGTAYGFSSAGTSGQLLQSNGTGAPTWVNASSVGTNYWDRTGTLVTPLTITDNIATLGNIGIGTTNPAAVLSVGSTSEFRVDSNGNITRINDVAYSFPASQAAADNYVLTNDGSGNLTWESVSGVGGITGSGNNGQLTFWNGTNSLSGSYGLFLDTSNNYLGIGTSAPNTALDINNGNITLSDNYWLGLGTAAGRVEFDNQATDEINFLGANVGIGTSSPSALLSVGAGNQFTVNGSGAITAATGITSSGNITFSGLSTDGVVTVSSGLLGSEAQLAIARGGTNSTATPTAGAIAYGTGTAYNFSSAGTSGQLLQSNGTGAPTWVNSDTVGINYWDRTGTLVTPLTITDNIATLGNIGIGTTNPAAALSVGSTSEFRVDSNGNITRINDVAYSFPASQAASDNYVLTNDGSGNLTWESVSGVGGLTGSGSTGQLTYWNGANSLTGDFNFFLDSNNARLGIGTSAPTTALDINNGNITLSDNYWLGLGSAAGRIEFDNQATDEINFLGANVGIGTSSPSALLSVGAGNQFTVNGSGAITAATGINSSGNITFSGLSTDGVVTVSSGLLGSEAQLAIARGGTNSTATPTAGAIAYGTGTAYGFSSAGTSGQLLQSNGTGAPTWVNSDSVGVNYWDRTGTLVTPLTITDNIATLGSLGIGNTNPAAALSVGATSEFRVDSNGNITRINDVAYSFPASQAASDNYVLTNDGSGNLTWESVSGIGGITGSGSTGQLTYWNGANSLTGSFNLFLDANNTRLGIGTSAPTTALDINNGNITLSDNYWLGLGTNAGRIEFDNQATDEINFLSANVGIGTSSPSALLSVGATNQFTVNSSGAITAAAGITSSGNITFSGLSTDGVVTVSSGLLGSEAQLAIARGGTNSTATPTAGAIAYGTGTAYNFSSAGTSGQLLQSNGTGAPTWVNASSVGTNYWDRTGTLVTPLTITDNIATFGSIGIGTTNPTGALQATGDEVRIGDAGTINFATADGDLYIEDALEVDGSTYLSTLYLAGAQVTSTAAEINLLDGSTAVEGGLVFGNGTYLTQDSANIFWDNSTKRLGIGTTGPQAALSVGATSEFRVDSNGNVTRINDVAYSFPASQAAGSSYVLSNDGSGNLTWESVAGVGAINGSGSTGQITYFNGASDVTGSFNLFWDGSTNRLGIGTSAPVTALDISNGNITLSDNYWLGLGTSAGRVEFDNQATDEINFLGANVGIGTSSPSALLSVGAGSQFTVNGSGAVTAATGITSSGNITFSGLSTDGVVTVSSGLLGSEAQLAIARGGTNSTATPTAGAIAYGTGTAYNFSSAGTSGQLLQSNGTGAPTWVNATSNYWDRTGTLVTPLTITDNVATLGNIGIGTTNPAADLDVGGGTLTAADGTSDILVADDLEVDGQIFAADGTAALPGYAFQSDTNTGIFRGGADNLRLTTGGAEALTADSLGNIGIGTTVINYQLDILSSDTTGGLRVVADSVTTGTGALFSFDGLSTGTGLSLASTSTAFSTGKLINIDWSPSSATTASGDLFTLNIGANGTLTGDIFQIQDNGTDLFRISQSGIESALPHSFTAAGDVSIAYDIQFTNQTSANIKSKGPLSIESGENFESLNLTLKTYNSGDIVFDVGDDLVIQSADPSIVFDVETATDTDFWLGVVDDGGGDDDDYFAIGDGNTPNGNMFLTINSSGLVGIGTTSPAAYLNLTGATTSNASLRVNSGSQPSSPASGDIYSDGTNLFFYNGSGWDDLTDTGTVSASYWDRTGTLVTPLTITDNIATLGSLGIGNTNPAAALGVGSSNQFQVTNAGLVSISSGTGAALSLTRSSAGQWISFNDGTDTWGLYNYAGSPEGNLYASTGALAMDTNTGTLYVKTDDNDTTGWTNLATGGSSQWTDAGTYIYAANASSVVVTDTGLLGIGTTGPTQALDINNGNIQISDNYWLGLGTAAGRIEFDDQTTDEINFLNADIGIGTSAPTAKLDVVASEIGSILKVNNTTNNGLFSVAGKTGGYADVQFGDLDDAGNFTKIQLDDEFQTIKLDSGGAISLGDVGTNYNGTIFRINDAGQNATLNTGRLGVGTTAPAATLDIGGGTLTAADGTSDILVADDLEVDGQIFAADGTAALPGYAFQSDTNTGLFRAGNDNLQIITAGAAALTADSLGNIGIGTTVINYQLDILSSDTTGGLRVVADSVTTGTGALFSFDGLSTGTGLSLASTSTAFSTGKLINIDWSPSSATTASGDLFTLNIGANGTLTGDIFQIQDNGTDLFRISQSGIESALPHSFTAAGDVSIAYDLQFTNQTSSYIKSKAPLYIEAGESFENNDLTFITYGTGDVVFDLSGTGTAVISNNDPSLVLDTATTTDTDFWLGVVSDGGNDDDDYFAIGDGNTPNGNMFLTVNSSGLVGIGTTSPAAYLNLTGATTSNASLRVNSGSQPSSPAVGDIYSNGTDLYFYNGSGWDDLTDAGAAGQSYWDRTGTLVTPLTITDNVATLGNVGIGTTNPAADLDVGGGTLTAADGTSDILVADDLEVDGQIFAADGTAALPGYAFQSDTNTGIFRGGADNLRLTTGGAEALTADSLGNIGIGTTVINYQLDILSSDTTGGLRVVADSVTSGTGSLFSFDGLTSGTGILIESSPGSSTTLSGDLLRLNVGSNVNVTGNILSIEDNGTDLFTINQTGITSALPHSFTAAGDVTFAYDIVLSNQTASVIESYGPFTIRAGENFESNNLTLQTYNAGDVYINLGVSDTGPAQLLVDATTDDFIAEFFNDGNLDTRQGLLVQGCLDTNPTSSCNFMQFNDGNGTALGAIEGNGSGSITYGTSGADYAELFDGDRTKVSGGDILALGSDGNITKAKPNTKILGAYSTTPSTLGNWFDGWETDNSVIPVGLVGQLKVNVSAENGAIEKGDPVAVSATQAGVGIKATTATRIVGFAMEATPKHLKGKDTVQIKVYVSPTWYDPSLYVGTFGELASDVQNVNTTVGELGTRLKTLEFTNELNNFGLVEEAINTLNTDVDSLRAEIAALTELMDSKETTESTEATESSASAVINPEGILAEIITIVDEFKDFIASLGLSVNTDENGENALTIASNLNVLGDSILSDLTLTGDLQAGFVKLDSLENSLDILGPSCYNTITGTYNAELCNSQTLYLQKNIAGNVDIFNGAIVFEANGNIKVDGTVEATKVVADEFAVKGASTLIGTATLEAGQTQVIISNENITATSKVFVTATNSTKGQQLFVIDKIENTSFTVAIDYPVVSNIEFDWWIVNVEQ